MSCCITGTFRFTTLLTSTTSIQHFNFDVIFTQSLKNIVPSNLWTNSTNLTYVFSTFPHLAVLFCAGSTTKKNSRRLLWEGERRKKFDRFCHHYMTRRPSLEFNFVPVFYHIIFSASTKLGLASQRPKGGVDRGKGEEVLLACGLGAGMRNSLFGSLRWALQSRCGTRIGTWVHSYRPLRLEKTGQSQLGWYIYCPLTDLGRDRDMQLKVIMQLTSWGSN